MIHIRFMPTAQQKASHPEHSVWVSASAGTGKTKILVDRYVRLLLAGVPARSILCLTFTNAAASEMEERILHMLTQWASMSASECEKALTAMTGNQVSDTVRHRAQQLFWELLHERASCRIQTIHSFCYDMLSRFSNGQDGLISGRIMSDTMQRQLLREAQAACIEQAYLEHHPSLQAAIMRLIGRTDVYRLADLATLLIGNDSALLQALENESIGLSAHDFSRAMGLPTLPSQAELFHRFYATIPDASTWNDIAEALMQGSASDQQKAIHIQALVAQGMRGEAPITAFYNRLFMTAQGTARHSLVSAKLATQHPFLLPHLQSQQEAWVTYTEQCKWITLCDYSSDVMVYLRHLRQHYTGLKHRHNALDYQDIIAKTLFLLRHSAQKDWMLQQLDARFSHLLVDEAQDTSHDQWQLIQAITEEFTAGMGQHASPSTLFVVGDKKQSIYRFQGADIGLFDSMHHRYERSYQHSDEEQVPSFYTIHLEDNYRSSQAVLRLVNHFCREAGSAMGHTAPIAPHQSTRSQAKGYVALWPLVARHETRDVGDGWKLPIERDHRPHPEKGLAVLIATDIAARLSRGEWMESTQAPLKPGDIMILVRHRTLFVESLIHELRQRHVPVSGLDRLILQEHIAAQDMLTAMEWSLTPHYDLALATCLKSPLGGMDEETLYAIAADRGEQSLWDALQAYAQRHPEWQILVDRYREWLAHTQDGPHQWLTHLLYQQRFIDSIIARLGTEALDPLHALCHVADEKEQEGWGLHQFLWHMQAEPLEIKRAMTPEINQVRIITIHGAKGLQSPLVYLTDSTAVPHTAASLLWAGSPEMPFYLPSKKLTPQGFESFIQTHTDEAMQEYYRLLYVAITRAEDNLIITGTAPRGEVPAESWYAQLAAIFSTYALSTPCAISDIELSQPHQWEDGAPGHPTTNAPASLPPVPSLPAYLYQSFTAPSSLAATATGLQEEKILHTSDMHRITGIMVHQGLRWAARCAGSERDRLLEAWIARQPGDASVHKDVCATIARCLKAPECADLFAHGRAEVPFSGMVTLTSGESKLVRGVVDWLMIDDTRAWAVECKTSERLPACIAEVPTAYLQQLSLYRALIARAYPTLIVRASFLYTAGPRVIDLTDEVFFRHIKRESCHH